MKLTALERESRPIKDLLHALQCDCDHARQKCEDIGCYAGPLAARVEKVLVVLGSEETISQMDSEEAFRCLLQTWRILNGEDE